MGLFWNLPSLTIIFVRLIKCNKERCLYNLMKFKILSISTGTFKNKHYKVATRDVRFQSEIVFSVLWVQISDGSIGGIDGWKVYCCITCDSYRFLRCDESMLIWFFQVFGLHNKLCFDFLLDSGELCISVSLVWLVH